MRKIYEIATGKELIQVHNIDADEAVKSGFYSYEPPVIPVKTEEVFEAVETRKFKKKHETSYSDPPLSE